MFTLMKLPYASEALSPVISAQTVHWHHQSHHKNYVDKLNLLIQDSGYEKYPLEEIIRQSYKKDVAIFNNAAQVANHDFFWNSLGPIDQSTFPHEGEFALAVQRCFGGQEGLRAQFIDKGVAHFGSGWVWLVRESNRALAIVTTKNAEPVWLDPDLVPLCVCDLWEHAYYLDYQSHRQKFIADVFDRLMNWNHVIERYAHQ